MCLSCPVAGVTVVHGGRNDRDTMRILVVEDEARILAFLTRGLEAEGYTVVAADNGRDGLALAAAGGVGPRRARLAAPRSKRAAGAARPPSRAAAAPGPDPLGALGPPDEAARVRARRDGLRGEAVRARRAARARARTAARGASDRGRAPAAGRAGGARPRAPAGADRRARHRPVRPQLSGFST